MDRAPVDMAYLQFAKVCCLSFSPSSYSHLSGLGLPKKYKIKSHNNNIQIKEFTKFRRDNYHKTRLTSGFHFNP